MNAHRHIQELLLALERVFMMNYLSWFHGQSALAVDALVISEKLHKSDKFQF